MSDDSPPCMDSRTSSGILESEDSRGWESVGSQDSEDRSKEIVGLGDLGIREFENPKIHGPEPPGSVADIMYNGVGPRIRGFDDPGIRGTSAPRNPRAQRSAGVTRVESTTQVSKDPATLREIALLSIAEPKVTKRNENTNQIETSRSEKPKSRKKKRTEVKYHGKAKAKKKTEIGIESNSKT